MNYNQEKQAIERFFKGESFTDIARNTGISEEQLRAAIKARVGSRKGPDAKYNRMIFPNLAKLIRYENISIRRLAFEANMTTANMSNMLYGVHEPKLSTIEKILAAIGMTFEEAFARKEDTNA